MTQTEQMDPGAGADAYALDSNVASDDEKATLAASEAVLNQGLDDGSYPSGDLELEESLDYEELQAQPARPRLKIRWGRVGIACLFAFLVLALALFAWNRWYRFDDAADIQGVWRDVNSGASMSVDASYIKLADDAIYEYSIDTFAKTITYSFTEHTGTSSYRFSEDRQQLVLEDGAQTDWGLALHFYDDPGFAEGELADGLTRLEKASSEVPKIELPGSKRPASPLTHPSKKLEELIAASTASSSSSSSSQTSSSEGEQEDEDEAEEEDDGLIVSPDRDSKGYYDENGIFVVVSLGHYDENGEWVDSGASGYYDENGLWVESNEYAQDALGYDAYGNLINTEGYGDGAAYGYDAYGIYGSVEGVDPNLYYYEDGQNAW